MVNLENLFNIPSFIPIFLSFTQESGSKTRESGNYHQEVNKMKYLRAIAHITSS